MIKSREKSLLLLSHYHRSRNSLVGVYSIDDLVYTQSVYFDADLVSLEQRYGKSALERIYANIFAVYAIVFYTFLPEKISLGPLSGYVTDELKQFVLYIFLNAKSEWIYVNNAGAYKGPNWIDDSNEGQEPILIEPGAVSDLVFSGGGKDSLIAMKILDQCRIPFATISVSEDLYGRSDQQHDRSVRVASCTGSTENHKVYSTGTWVNSPRLKTANRENVRTFIPIEYEVYFFFGIIQCLSEGYQQLAVGFERSAEEGNLIDGFEGVNHQWDKTETFISVIRDYIRRELVGNLDLYSVLGNLYDPGIFLHCRKYAGNVALTHSCNVAKPWCFRCVKCAYTLFSMAAYLGDQANDFWGIDILNHPGLLPHISDLLGEGNQKPFECIGSKEEVILLFELLRRREAAGKAMEIYSEKRGDIDFDYLADRYMHVYPDSYLPALHQEKIMREMTSTVAQQRALLLNTPGVDRGH